jgi:hypothetical protein
VLSCNTKDFYALRKRTSLTTLITSPLVRGKTHGPVWGFAFLSVDAFAFLLSEE